MIVGIVGKANVGKSTFFKALTLADIIIANYPFATIKPNHGVGFLRIPCADTFFNTQCHPREGFCIQHQRFVPVNVIDVAGLVPGAHLGKGMGNQFLDDLNQASVLIHVVDAAGSTNAMGEPVDPGSYDPAKDILFLEEELDFWYLRILKKGWERFAKTIQQEKGNVIKALAKQLSGLGVTEDMLKEFIEQLGLDTEKPSSWSEDELFRLVQLLRHRTKPMVIAANKVDLEEGKKNYERLKKEFPEKIILPCAADAELALKGGAFHKLINYLPGDSSFTFSETAKLTDVQKNALEHIKKSVLDVYGSTGLQKILNAAVLEVIKYIAVFPGGLHKLEDQYGHVLPDCFLMPPGTTAFDFAAKLHTDFAKNFIRAIDVKKRMPVGKEHVLQHCDVVEIVAGK